MPLVTIIIPVYNTENYLPDCLLSCCRQTLSDIEILCIDDKSTDNSAEILKNYAQVDGRIKIISHEKNFGLASTRNTGIINATGEYSIFLDSDDMMPPSALENLYQKAKETKADLIFGDFYTFFENLDKNYRENMIRNPWFKESFSKFSKCFSTDEIYNYPDKNFLYKFLYDNIYTMCVWAKLYKTSIFKNNNILAPSKLRCAEDFCMLKEYMHNCDNFAILDDVVLLYRKHKNSFTAKKVSYVFSIFDSYPFMINMMKKTGYLSSQYTNIHKFYLDMYSAHYKFCPSSLLIKYWWRFHKEIRKWNKDKINLLELDNKQKSTLTLYNSPTYLFVKNSLTKLFRRSS